MNQSKAQKVFIQFRYCPLCRSNHKRGKKHVLTERHQQIVTNVLNKYSKRIAEAKKSSEEPLVKDMAWSDANRKFWCYFCQSDIECHRVNHSAVNACVVQHGGMLEHIVREDHVKNTTSFLKENRMDMKRTPDFILTSQIYIKFLENVEKAVSVFFQAKEHLVQEMASSIRVQAAMQQQIMAAGLADQNKQLQEKQSHRPVVVHTNINIPYGEDGQRKKTAQAFGQGLTTVDRSKEDDSLGNIYSNAVPPWMIPDPEDEKDITEIGPTIKDLEKHRKLEKKAKLPATRVGANFDRSADESDSWMPSFGGVWHHSRRSDSQKQFNRRHIGKHKAPQSNTAFLTSGHSPDHTFVYPSTEALYEDAPIRKIPRTSATAPAPWNSYIQSPYTESDQSHPSLISSHIQTARGLPEHSFHSPNQIFQPSNENFGSVESQTISSSVKLSVKPYVSKRRRQNSSGHCNASTNPECSSTYFPSHSNSFHPPHLSTSVFDNHYEHSTANHYPNQPSGCNRFSQSYSVNTDADNQYFYNGFVRSTENPENKWASLPPTSSSIQQPIRLISTPLLQQKKEKR
ncbi:hypothetical protein RRG08_048607 [Elysia crispata]|uniref:Coiled-coil domain-containing protein 84 n=1 Tax=Elysia crispata TaxID=231223 RepID=A0AAE1AEA6_9GAST|nr:hypothetical protein RRG08_048607 [Elysia crispata]